MSKALQSKISREYKAEFAPIAGACFLDYTGMTAELFREFRAHLRSQGFKCKVVKNRLFKREAIEEEMDLSAILKGPVCVVYADSEDQIVLSAKIIKDWIREHKFPKIKGGFLNGEVLDGKQFGQLVEIGSREQVLSRLLSVIQMPMSNLVGTINAVPQKLAGLLLSYEEKLKES